MEIEMASKFSSKTVIKISRIKFPTSNGYDFRENENLREYRISNIIKVRY